MSTNKPKEEELYDNEWCHVTSNGEYYILRSKQAHYNDQYYSTLEELCRKAGISMNAILEFKKVS